MLERGASKSIDDEDNEGRTALDRCEKGSPSEAYGVYLWFSKNAS